MYITSQISCSDLHDVEGVEGLHQLGLEYQRYAYSNLQYIATSVILSVDMNLWIYNIIYTITFCAMNKIVLAFSNSYL